ncbi:pyridoxamine 5'-phosphate oxidase [Alphaproteobacteria bacterium]|jgi:pyridoxamine 5'-phosphate oxidase|nr:pyridoxamine 5'-phosphate oxidase [Alphaproteobacteria bacterium]MDA8624852.1 pyridoxamine 5'-phosphate oxidase [Alphaproteobacteria bacterium]MDA8642944.1 pyridoxamine 5'-phosphate oxidase [Alphaproteobacteria bacterium]MDA9591078.1 pyridoxamine 5'-phosphate oxidase [Alphaproteobacteria bacterium]MDB2381139.1 pyridoxamine 5'-phosphate oxidase [Alphaproteobacteria bacterium]
MSLFIEPPHDPIAAFDGWLQEAAASEPNDPNAMSLATVDADGMPNARMVLLKGHDARGFVFYTNLESQKGGELADNAQAALCFHWKSLHRQVRVQGPISAVSDAEADAYFNSRGRQSRIGAWASQQSRPLANRAELEAAFAKIDAQYPDEDIPRPPHWSGRRITPLRIEFWQDGDHRLHDRLVFKRASADAAWETERLYP